MDAIMNEKTGIIKPVGMESTKSDAISVYKSNLERDPGNARIYIEMARCHIRAKNYRKAVECIEIYLHSDQNDFNAHCLLAAAHSMMGDYARSIDLYTKALGIAPGEASVHLHIGDQYSHMEKHAEAANEYSTYLQSFPEDLSCLLKRAGIYKKLGKKAKALSDCRKMLKIKPHYMPAEMIMNDLGYTCRNGKMERYDRSVEKKKFSLAKIPSVKLDSVIGLDRAKEELRRDLIYPLQYKERAKEYGVGAGGGIMLYGAPGCGKTLIARAVAGEAGVSIIEAKIPEILSMWVGVAEKNIHKLFEKARKSAPCILFFDELEALGTSREVTSRRSSWVRGMISVFLTELDGLSSSNDNVLVMGATNAPWMVDPALKRHGRMGKLIYVAPPDGSEREALFKEHLKGFKVSGELDYTSLARSTANCTGADIATICSEANKMAWEAAVTTGEGRFIDMALLERSIEKEKPNLSEWYSMAKAGLLGTENKGMYEALWTDINKGSSTVSDSTSYR